jgi:hypothetical protein
MLLKIGFRNFRSGKHDPNGGFSQVSRLVQAHYGTWSRRLIRVVVVQTCAGAEASALATNGV